MPCLSQHTANSDWGQPHPPSSSDPGAAGGAQGKITDARKPNKCDASIASRASELGCRASRTYRQRRRDLATARQTTFSGTSCTPKKAEKERESAYSVCTSTRLTRHQPHAARRTPHPKTPPGKCKSRRLQWRRADEGLTTQRQKGIVSDYSRPYD